MNFIESAEYWESHARAWARVFGKKWKTMHPAIRGGASVSQLRAQFRCEELVCQYIEEKSAHTIFDCGSGYAASMLYIANIHPDAVLSGICASEAEIDLTRNSIREADKIKSVRVFRGDFEDSANYRVFPPQDIVYCIDSLRYARNFSGLLRILHQQCAPGGLVIVCDYFSTRRKIGEASVTTGALSLLRPKQEVLSAALDSGFSVVFDGDWSTTSIRSFFEWVADSVLTLFSLCFDRSSAHVYRFRSAMEKGIRRGTVGYRAIVFQKL